MPGLVGVLSVLGMAVVAPLGLLRLGTPGVRRLVPFWPPLALVAGAGLLLDRGPLAVALVLPYAAACHAVTALAALRALRRLRDRRGSLTAELVAGFAGAALAVAGQSLVAERAAYELLGFDLGTLGLTVAHFHFAGYAAVLLAGLTARAAPGPAAAAGAWAVPVGTAVTFVGFFTSEYVELVGAAVLATGLLVTSVVVLRRVVPADRFARALLVVAALVAPLTMALAVWWALGEATGIAHPGIRRMAETHGVANALGVGLCGLLGWHRAAPPPL